MVHQVLKVAAGATVGMAVGALYYNPSVSPLGAMWAADFFKGKKPEEVVDPTGPMAVSALCNIGLAALLSTHNFSRDSHEDIARLVGKIGLVLLCVELPHALFEGKSFKMFFINHLHGILTVSAITAVMVFIK